MPFAQGLSDFGIDPDPKSYQGRSSAMQHFEKSSLTV